MISDDKSWTETSAAMTRREIEDSRAHLKCWFQNQSVERHTFNKICDQAVRALKADPVSAIPEPKGCPTPGACSCPGVSNRLAASSVRETPRIDRALEKWRECGLTSAQVRTELERLSRDMERELAEANAKSNHVVKANYKLIAERDAARTASAIRGDQRDAELAEQWKGRADDAGQISRAVLGTIESGPFAGLPKPHKVPDGYVLVDEVLFKTILEQLTPEQSGAVAMAEGQRIIRSIDSGRSANEG